MKGTIMLPRFGTSKAAIFGRIVQPDQGTLSIAAAKATLVLDFSDADKGRTSLSISL